jgi:hypothetical protein
METLVEEDEESSRNKEGELSRPMSSRNIALNLLQSKVKFNTEVEANKSGKENKLTQNTIGSDEDEA